MWIYGPITARSPGSQYSMTYLRPSIRTRHLKEVQLIEKERFGQLVFLWSYAYN